MIHQLPDGFTARPATPDDAERVATLWNDRSEVTRGERPSTPERLLKTWDHPKFDLSTDSLLVFAPDGALIGYAHVRDVKEPPVDVFAGHSVHPDHDEDDGLWDCVFAWMDARARRVIPKAPADARIALVAGTSDEDKKEQTELEGHGFEHSRTFHRMTISFEEPVVPAALPEGIAIRTFHPGADDIELVTVHREAFADHYGILRQPFETDLEEWHQLMQDNDFDASLWFLAIDVVDGVVVGFCICKAVAPRDPERGGISDLGVRPTWRRRGIGQALLLHAFTELHRRGIEGGVLTVDSKNKSGAPALYERVGMHPVRASHTYVKELRPGRNYVPQ